MSERCYVIDEPSLSILGTFDSWNAAYAFADSVRAANPDMPEDELTVSCGGKAKTRSERERDEAIMDWGIFT